LTIALNITGISGEYQMAAPTTTATAKATKLNKVELLKQEKDGLDVWADVLRYAKDGYESIHPDDFPRMRWYGIYQQRP
jgi:hypothetical protein